MFDNDYDEGLGMGWDREDDLADRMDNEAWEDAQLEQREMEMEDEVAQDEWDDDELDADYDMGE